MTLCKRFCYQFCDLNFGNHVCGDAQFSLYVELDETQVAAVGQGSVEVLRERQTYKKQKILHQYVCFCSAKC